jgi:diguanylate cyclase (GGDEF)-like protein/PAS domain S-box-containing protein
MPCCECKPNLQSESVSETAQAEAGLHIPSRLYGRDREHKQLLHAYGKAGAGEGRLLLLSGPSGSGKTVLAQSLKQAVIERNGFFLEGKFNQYQQGIPLFAVRQALRQLVQDIIADGATADSRISKTIQRSLGQLGRLVTDLVPELETLIGEQPAVPSISPFEAAYRFASVIRGFLSVFCRPEHPLVLFIDDWQWADSSSLLFLEHLQLNTELRFLLVIVSYRDNEVNDEHPLNASIEELNLNLLPIQSLQVTNLERHEVSRLLSDTLTPSIERSAEFINRVFASTRGNPFFIRSLLETLHASHSLWHDSSEQAWQWNMHSAFLSADDGDVTHLFVQRLERLPGACRQMLSIAACLGNRFQLDDLALASDVSAGQCLDSLLPAIEQNMIVAMGHSSRVFRFYHDRVQQAAHSFIAEDDLPGIRLKIARLLDARLDAEQKHEQLHEITDHFNAGIELIEQEQEIQRLIDLNIAAGAKSRAATAYRSALHFFRTAGKLLSTQTDSLHYCHARHGPAMQLYLSWSECEFLEGSLEQAQQCLAIAEQCSENMFDLTDVLCQSILQNTLLARYAEAIDAGLEALSALGIDLPSDEFESARDAEIDEVYRRISNKTFDELQNMPPMSDVTMLAATRVLISMGPPCYRAHQRLWSVLVPRVVNLTLEYGPIPQIGYSHTAMGGLLAWVNDDFATARLFEELSFQLMSKVFGNPADQSVFYLMVGSSSRHWFEHLSACSEDYERARDTGLASGNLQYAAYAFGHNMYCQFYQGVVLDELIEESNRSLQFSKTRRNQWAIDLLEGGMRVFGHLKTGDQVNADWKRAYSARLDVHNNIQVACIMDVLQAGLFLILDEPERAHEHAERAAPMIYTVGTQGLLPWPEFVFCRLLILTRLVLTGRLALSDALREDLREAVERIRVWSRHVADNYRYKLAIAEAAMAEVEGQPARALELFNRAIDDARAGHFIQWEAFAYEGAARVAIAAGCAPMAQVYWEKAYQAYFRWGALEKLRRMEQGLLQPVRAGSQQLPLYPTIQGYFENLRQRLHNEIEGEKLEESGIVRDLSLATERLRKEVAQRRQAENDLRLAASVFENAREGVLITDSNGRIIDTNDAFTALTGYSHDEVIGKTARILQSGRHDKAFYSNLWQALVNDGYWHGEVWNRKKNGELFAELLTISAVRDHHGETDHYVGLFTDITNMKAHQHKLEMDAYHDALTKLPNRTLFADRLRQAMNRSQRDKQQIAVIFIDLDGFKAVNDQFGHDAGDQLLLHVTRQMKKVLRDSDTLARLGGDEFVAVACGLEDKEQVVSLFSRLLMVISEGIVIDNNFLQVSASLGATFYPQEDDIEAEQLLRQSDQAMYQAKLAGKNRFHIFDAVRDRSIRTHHESIDRIREGLDNGEFSVFYQPKVNMRSGRVIGVEALVRWQHPDNGTLAPGRFLPAIEDNDLIITLSEQVMDQAFTQLQRWLQQGLELSLSVNIAAYHLQQSDFVERLGQIAARYPDMPTDRVEFEIVETSALQNIDHVNGLIRQCMDLGYSFSLDDFGTGYSSLTYMKRLPVRSIKIDQSFVRDMLEDADDLSILQGVIGLASSFDREVIAEGIETPEHGELLLWLGCELGQGYGIARPMPAAELSAWIEGWAPHPNWSASGEISNELFMVLMAVIKHRTWIHDVEAFLQGKLGQPPELDMTRCQFASWLNRLDGDKWSKPLKLLNELHRKVHQKARQLVTIKESAGNEAALARLHELQVLGDTMLRALREFVS